MKDIIQLKEPDMIEWLALRRQENGISIETLSEHSGITPAFIRTMEKRGKATSKTIFWKYVITVCRLTGGRLNLE